MVYILHQGRHSDDGMNIFSSQHVHLKRAGRNILKGFFMHLRIKLNENEIKTENNKQKVVKTNLFSSSKDL